MLRGLCVLMITVDHVSRSPLGYFTLINFAFFDAAEVFFLVSGILLGRVHGPAFLHGAWVDGTLRALVRAGQLYVAQLAILLAMLGLYALGMLHPQLFQLGGLLGGPFPVDSFWNPPTPSLLLDFVTLRQSGSYTTILALYIVYILVFPLFMAVYVKARPVAAALVAAVWLMPQLVAVDAAGWPGYNAQFHLWSWGALFYAGALVGLATVTGWPALRLRRDLLLLAGTVAALGCAVMIAGWSDRWLHFAAWPEQLRRDLGAAKLLVEWPRLLHLAAVAYVVAWAARTRAGHAVLGRLELLSVVGRHALLGYAAGVILSLAGSMLVMGTGNHRIVGSAAALAAVVSILAMCKAVDMATRRHRGAAGRPAPATPETRPARGSLSTPSADEVRARQPGASWRHTEQRPTKVAQ